MSVYESSLTCRFRRSCRLMRLIITLSVTKTSNSSPRQNLTAAIHSFVGRSASCSKKVALSSSMGVTLLHFAISRWTYREGVQYSFHWLLISRLKSPGPSTPIPICTVGMAAHTHRLTIVPVTNASS